MKNKIHLCLLLILSASFLFSQKKPEPPKNKLVISYTLAYCGGAAPSEEIKQQLNTPKTLANCNVMIVRYNNMALKGPIARTNANGEIFLSLQPGKYKIFIASNSKNKADLPFNKKCKKLRQMLLGEFEFTGKDTGATIRIPCNPCDPDMKKRA